MAKQLRHSTSVNCSLRRALLASAIALIAVASSMTPALFDTNTYTNKSNGDAQQTALAFRNTTTNDVLHVKVVAHNATNRTTLSQPQATGILRHDWRHHTPLSHFAKLIHSHQTDCSLSTATYYIDNDYGIGSHISLWSQGICNAMQLNRRLRTVNPHWLWLDQTLCDAQVATRSPWLCYFPQAECQCGNSYEELAPVNVSDPRDKKRHQCTLLKEGNSDTLHAFRAASTEVLFQTVSEVVIAEAQRQIGLLFNGSTPPDDLITVHIRWGDKFWEMDLAPIAEYVEAVSYLLRQQGKKDNSTANIYLATEDPKVVHEFSKGIPPGWNVFYDRTVVELKDFRPNKGNRASHMTKNTKGRAGLVAMGSLLVAMEAKWFVLTTASNWSRVMDHLRTQIINPRCNNCTHMVDLRPGIW